MTPFDFHPLLQHSLLFAQHSSPTKNATIKHFISQTHTQNFLSCPSTVSLNSSAASAPVFRAKNEKSQLFTAPELIRAPVLSLQAHVPDNSGSPVERKSAICILVRRLMLRCVCVCVCVGVLWWSKTGTWWWFSWFLWVELKLSVEEG